MSSWLRPAAVAGRFYPDDPQKLRAALIAHCPPAAEIRRPYAIMAPHAGYIYSGKIAGEVYRRTEVPNEVIVLCPNHTGRGDQVSVWAEGVWETPLGDVPVAAARAHQLLARFPTASADKEAHQNEHAIEVHLPFLLWRNPNVQIVPVVVGGLSWEGCRQLGEALAACADGALIVASTDMSHYISAREALRLDEMALAEVDRCDGEALYRTVANHNISMCGFIPTSAVLAAVQVKGGLHSERLAYGNSGETTGDQEDVVAYAASWFVE